MKKLIRFLPIIIFLTICLTSCFDLKEKIYIRKDGSGTFTFTVDMGQSKMLLDMAKRMSGDDKLSSPTNNINNSFDKGKSDLEKIKGITNVKSITDENNYVFGVQFDFANIEALNKALEKTLKKDETKGGGSYVEYRWRKGELERLEKTNMKEKILTEVKKEKQLEASGFDPSSIFYDVKYSTIFSFENKVKDVSHKGATLSEDGKTVTVVQKLFNDNDKNKNLQNKITF
jgi:hypothetical protein